MIKVTSNTIQSRIKPIEVRLGRIQEEALDLLRWLKGLSPEEVEFSPRAVMDLEDALYRLHTVFDTYIK